jgi:hypothetical protein
MSPSLEQIIQSLRELPAKEQEEVRRWLGNGQAADAAEPRVSERQQRSENSLRWLKENRLNYTGQWVALDGDRLIAQGKTAQEVYLKAKAAGIDVPFVELVAAEESAPYTGGWLS